MNSTKVTSVVQKVIKNFYDNYPKSKTIITSIYESCAHARVVIVGGTVRDTLLEELSTISISEKNYPHATQDIDLEVYGCALDTLEKILKNYGAVRTVGKSFGVLRIDGINIDWSIPRTDGPGRKPEVTYNPHATYADAFIRRDLTINAMGIELPNPVMPLKSLAEGKFIDPYNGLQDIQNKILRATNPDFFTQDPLRYFRIMQFAGRFPDFSPDETLYTIGKAIDLNDLSLSRIDEEFYKLFTLAPKPSRGIDWLHKTDRLKEIMPEVHALIGVEQNPQWHPEGDVFEHTKQAIDAAALQTYASTQDRYIMTIAALCHDLGKAVSSKIIDGRIRSFGHEITGVPLAKSLMQRITERKNIIPIVCKLVRWHMVHIGLTQDNVTPAAYKRLAQTLAPETTCAHLVTLGICDQSARNPSRQGPFEPTAQPFMKEFQERIKRYGVLNQPEKPLLTGKDLEYFVPVGPEIGKLLRVAYALQIEKNITDKETLLELLKKQHFKNC